MRIAIHDADAEHLKAKNKFPNYALMKISAYHKERGDTVEWFNALEANMYDKQAFFQSHRKSRTFFLRLSG